MTAETLRRAAALMRERATAANTIAWYIPETLIRGKSLDPVDEEVDAAFIASMSPAVALAVADWLDATAAEHESDSGNPTVNAFFGMFDTAPDVAALAVARAYLGTEATS